MFEFENKEALDAEIRAALEKIRTLSDEELMQIYGGKRSKFGDTREEYSTNSEDIDRSIYGALYD